MAKDYKTWKQGEMRSKVYNALAEIMFEYDANKEDMDQAIEWFNIKFYEDEYDED